ncbi:MAG TPA: glutamate ABC transporter substrate-binding protein [Pseudonocardiaceae bacterium]
MKRWVLAVVTLALAAGCGSEAAPTTSRYDVEFTVPQPVGAAVQEPTTTTGPEQAPCPDALASIRPPATLPPPGAMPAGSTMAAIAQRGQLRVGVDQNTYGFGFRDSSSGDLEGFDIDVARQMALAIFGDQTKIQFVTMASADREPALMEGRVDMVVRTFTITCDRKQRINFSTVYFEAGQQVLVNRGSEFRDLESLAGKRVCSASGSTSIGRLLNAAVPLTAVGVPNWTDCLVMLQQGQVDAVSTDDTILAGLAAQDPNTEVVGGRFSDEPYGIGMPLQSPDLVAFVNGVLDRMRRDGTWAAIHQRWLSELGPAPAPPTPRYLP